MMDANNNSGIGRIEVLRNSDNIVSTYIKVLGNAKSRWDYCADIKALSVVLAIESIKKALLDAKETRDIMIRFVTEVTGDNIPHCKEMMKIGKVRHLDGVKGNFGISDTEYIATATPIGSEPIIPYAVYSNVKEDIQQQRYIFDILSFQGVGLGLFISRSIIEAHGGKIWAENNNKEGRGQKGATFFFTLPIINGLPTRPTNITKANLQ